METRYIWLLLRSKPKKRGSVDMAPLTQVDKIAVLFFLMQSRHIYTDAVSDFIFTPVFVGQ